MGSRELTAQEHPPEKQVPTILKEYDRTNRIAKSQHKTKPFRKSIETTYFAYANSHSHSGTDDIHPTTGKSSNESSR